jgi:hypothetical protein
VKQNCANHAVGAVSAPQVLFLGTSAHPDAKVVRAARKERGSAHFLTRYLMGKGKKHSKKAFQKLIGIMQSSYPGRDGAGVPQDMRYSIHDLRDEIMAIKYMVRMILRRVGGSDVADVNEKVFV